MTAPTRADELSEGGRDRAMDIRDFVEALRSRWKTIAFSAAVTTGLGLTYLAFTPTTYTATVSVLVDARPRAPVGSDPAANVNAQADTILVESQVKLFSSDTVLRRVVQREGLADDPDFVPVGVGLRARLMAAIGLGSPAPVTEDRVSRAVLSLARLVIVKRSERTYVIDVDVSSRDPVKAARLANSVAEAYLTDQVDARATNVRRDASWLNQRIGELQARVQDAENRVQAYRAEHGITDANGKSVGDQELADLSSELGKARARVIDAKTRWERYREVVNSSRINDLPADASKSAVLDKLRGQYAEITRQEANLRTTLGDRHPAMLEVQNQLRDTRAQITAELKRLADAAGVEYQVARDAEKETVKRVEEARGATNTRNQSSVELRELERDVDASKAVYEKFLRARETNDVQNADGPGARVIAPALPPTAPSAPKTMAILFASVASGLFAGIGLALFNDYMAQAGPTIPRRRDPDMDGEGALDTEAPPLIVTTPRIGARRAAIGSLWEWMTRTRADENKLGTAGSPLEEVARAPESEFSRAIAQLHKALMGGVEPRRGRRRRARVMLVASMDDGAGKTTIAVNLARWAAKSGQRTLLIDANPEQPGLARVIPAGAVAGLIDLGGQSRPVYKVSPDLWLVPILAAEERVVARLERRADVERIDQMSRSFDLVIMDGPTIDFDGEAANLASAVDRVIVVAAAAGYVPNMRDIVEVLDIPEHKIAGAVVSTADIAEAA